MDVARILPCRLDYVFEFLDSLRAQLVKKLSLRHPKWSPSNQLTQKWRLTSQSCLPQLEARRQCSTDNGGPACGVDEGARVCRLWAARRQPLCGFAAEGGQAGRIARLLNFDQPAAQYSTAVLFYPLEGEVEME